MIRRSFKFIFQVIFWFFAFIGFIIFLGIFFLRFSDQWPFHRSLHSSATNSILSLHLNGPYLEHTDTGAFGALLFGKQSSLYHLTHAIFSAAHDPKVKGLIVRIDEPHLGVAQIQELREALLAFRKSGKPSWCYADNFGESSSGTPLYYLATACQEIWLQPLGTINLTGLSLEVPFAKEALEKLDIKPEMIQRKEYKSYMETFTRNDFSEPHRESMQALIDSIQSQFVEGIAKERGMAHDHVRTLINNGPYLTKNALTEKLIDRIDYRHNLIPAIHSKLGKEMKTLSVERYLAGLKHSSQGNKVALIFGSGIITSDARQSPLADLNITANETYKAFQLAIEDQNVKAIVYRINSGGGSPTASETIYGIINYARFHAKKPVIISMSDAAASGGYWIAVAGSKIVAQPATLTGSIGVVGGKFVLSGFLEKLGLHFHSVSTTENAGMWSMAQSFTPDQWAKMNGLMDHIYQAFTSRVAAGRRMTPEQVEKVARGRVWTGEQALALGLVDQLGGLHLALDMARKEAHLPVDAPIHIYPGSKTFFESLSSLLHNEDESTHVQTGIFGVFSQTFKKLVTVLTLLLSKEEALYAPVAVGEIK